MQLDEMLTKYSAKEIGKKTKISEENIELLLSEDFGSLAKAKALGFISIIEREYSIDMSEVKKSALEYYTTHNHEDDSIVLNNPLAEEQNKRSKWVIFLLLGLLALATWYFFTQFDKKMLNSMISFSENETKNIFTDNTQNSEKKETIENNITTIKTSPTMQIDKMNDVDSKTEKIFIDTELNNTIKKQSFNIVDTAPRKVTVQTASEIQNTMVREIKPNKITLKPDNRLWFGMINIDTKKRKNSIISDDFTIDVQDTSWLIATSSAPFSFVNDNETKEYNDAQKHYFKVSDQGIESLSRDEYIAQGGYRKW